jgi:hypothetical protein
MFNKILQLIGIGLLMSLASILLCNMFYLFGGFMKWFKENWDSTIFLVLVIIGGFLSTMYIIESINYHKLVTQFNEKWGKTETAKLLQEEQASDTINWFALISIDARDTSFPFLGSKYENIKIKTQYDMIIWIDSIFPEWMDTIVIIKYSTRDTIKVALKDL